MSGVVTPPPRPPRPYLPTHNRKDGAKSADLPSPDTSSIPQRSYTFSGGSDRPLRPQRPIRKQRTGSESSTGRENFSPERSTSPFSKLVERQVEKRTRSPLRKSTSEAGTQDDADLRRWSYGFESEGSSQSSYRPRAPPPRPPVRQLSSPDPNKTETMTMQDPKNDLQSHRRSYTFGSAKSLPSYPVHRSKGSSSEREASTSPERRLSPGPSGGVDVMGTLMEKSHSAGSSLNKSAPPSRPSRPPPPRAMSLPKAATLTTYKNQQDREQKRPHSKSTAEGQRTGLTRPLSPQRAIDQPPTETNESVQESGGPPDETTATSSEAPVVPPRPFLPPRPFPPGNRTSGKQISGKQSSGKQSPGKQSPGRVKGTRKRHTKRSNIEKIRIPPQSHEEKVPPEVQSDDVFSEPMTDEPEHVSTDNQEIEKEPLTSGEPSVSNNKDVVPPLQNTEGSPSESAPAQEQSQAPKSEEPSDTPNQPPSPVNGISDTKEDINKVLYEEEDQISPLPTPNSPQPRGNRFINSMKKSFRSLRSPNRRRRQPSTLLGRPHSESSLVTSEQSGKYPDPLPQGIIQPIVVQCVAYLNKESVLKEEGLFRIPGDVAVIKQLRERFIAGYEVDLSQIVDPHTVAGLLKLHFREQRVSMIPRGQTLASITQAVKDKDVESVRDLIKTIDVSHIAMLRLVAELLTMVVSFSEVNRMTSGTLATSCAPSMFPYLPTSSAVIVMKFLVDHCAEIFQQ